MKKISVVTVCLNSERTIGGTLLSFLRQRYENKELLIVDGGSTDQTLEIVKGMGLLNVRVISEPDDGLYYAMNKGLDAFSGDAVGFLNSDDTFHDDHVLTRLADALSDADVVYGDIVMVRDHIGKKPVRLWRSGEFRTGKLRLGWCPPHPTFYMSRAVVEAVGQFDCQYRLASDYDLMLRVLERPNFRVRYIPHLLVDFALGGQSTGSLRAMIRGNIECLRSRRAHFGPRLIDAAFLLRPLRKVIQFATN